MSTLVPALGYLRELIDFRVAAPAPAGVDIPLQPRRVESVLACSAALLLALGSGVSLLQLAGHDHLWGLLRLAGLNDEQNLPTWFASAQLLLAAASAALAMSVAPACDRRSWGVLAAVFVALSVDEAASVHELSNAPLRAAIGTRAALFFPWILGGLALAAAVCLLEWRLLRRLPRATARGMICAGACYVAGAVGLEMFAAPVYATGAKLSLVHTGLVTAEEGLELIGIAWFVVVVLRYAGEQRAAELSVDDRGDARCRGVRLSPRAATHAAVAVAVTLAAISLGAQVVAYRDGNPAWLPWVRLVNLSREGNIPTWWQSSTLLACAGLAAIIAASARRSPGGLHRQWGAVAVAFAYLSVDEGAGIHELAVDPLREAFHTTGLLYYPWVVVGAAVSLTAAAASRSFVGSLPAPTRRLFGAAVVVFLTGALGFESIGGLVAGAQGRANLTYAAVSTAEELLEMIGVALAARALLEYIRDHVGTVRLGAGSW